MALYEENRYDHLDSKAEAAKALLLELLQEVLHLGEQTMALKTRVLVLAEWDESLHWVPAPTAAKTRVFQYFRPEISPHGEEYLLLFVCFTVSLRSNHRE